MQSKSMPLAIAAAGFWLIAAGCTSPRTALNSQGTLAAPQAALPEAQKSSRGKSAKFSVAARRDPQGAASMPALKPTPVAGRQHDIVANQIQLAGALQSADVRQQIPEFATDGTESGVHPDVENLEESRDGARGSLPGKAVSLPAPPPRGASSDDESVPIPDDDVKAKEVWDVITEKTDEVPSTPLRATPSGRPPAARVSDLHEGTDSMHLDDVDVRKVLEILSREHHINILVSPNVSGRVTANLSGLNFEETLDAVLRSCKLIAQREGGVIYVYSAQELAPLNSEGNGNDPIGTRVYQLNYIRSTDLQGMIKPLLSPVGKMTTSPAARTGIGLLMAPSTGGSAAGGGGSSGGGGGGSGGSGGGSGSGGQSAITGGDSLSLGETVVIQDRESNLAVLDEIVRKLDCQPQQVLIEAVILSTTLNKNLELGVNFGVVDSAGRVLSMFGNGAAINAATGFLPQSVLQAGTGLVTQGFANDEHGIKFGFVDKNVTGFIRALESVGNVEVLATPRLLVLNKQPAELLLGQRLGYAVASQSLVSTVQNVQFLNVGTLLRVRPFISSDGMVRMEIHPERSTGQVVNNIPSTTTSEVTTNVLVPDGATIVIGGLMDNEENQQHNGIPVLGRLPLVGALFRDRVTTLAKKELIVLLTVQIWNPKPAAGADASAGKALKIPLR